MGGNWAVCDGVENGGRKGLKHEIKMDQKIIMPYEEIKTKQISCAHHISCGTQREVGVRSQHTHLHANILIHTCIHITHIQIVYIPLYEGILLKLVL